MTIAPIQNIAIIGGTHGNEWTGVYLVRKFQQDPTLIARASLHVTTLLANPKAIALKRRYIDRDLNRCFQRQDLEDPTLSTYEDQRAKAIAAQLYPADGPPTDFILDIHSTTANMGLTLLLSSEHPVNLQLAAYLSHLNPRVNLCFREKQGINAPMLRSLSPLGCTLEVGPISQNVLSSAHFLQAEQLIGAILDYLDAWNQGQALPVPKTVPIYQAFATLDYPRHSNGELEAMIHPNLEGQDYQALPPAAPLFLKFTGETLYYEGNDIVYPIFINEAAYYEKQVAMVLTHKHSFAVSLE